MVGLGAQGHIMWYKDRVLVEDVQQLLLYICD